jgi:hypothetical protein
MTISAASTASRRSWQIPSQHRFCHDRPHRNITHDHPAAWFGQVRRILQEIAPFLWCNFFYAAAIVMSRREDGNYGHVSVF